MSKIKSSDESKTTEIIELALNDIETLVQAFNLINEICQVQDDISVDVADGAVETWVH